MTVGVNHDTRPVFRYFGSVSKLSQLALMPLPAGTKLRTHENSRLH